MLSMKKLTKTYIMHTKKQMRICTQRAEGEMAGTYIRQKAHLLRWFQLQVDGVEQAVAHNLPRACTQTITRSLIQRTFI